MSQYVTKIRTDAGDLQIDYNALANLPTSDTTLATSGAFADSKTVGDALDNMSTMFSNPNLLINSDFRNPINQRGETIKTTNDLEWARAYFIDRWYVQHGATVELADGYIKAYASSTTDEAYFCQTLEHSLASDTYTVTINVKSVSGTVKIYGVELVAGINVITVTAEIPSVEIKLMSSSSIELYWVKLEQGSVSTPMIPRLYAEELQLCKRYYQTYRDNNQFVVLTQTYTSTTATNGRFNLPVEMRIAPLVTVHSLEVKEINNGTAITVTSTTGQSISNNAVEVTGVHASITVSYRYMYAKVELDAEIY